MLEERLASFSLIFIECDVFKDFEEVVDDFASLKARRSPLQSTLTFQH